MSLSDWLSTPENWVFLVIAVAMLLSALKLVTTTHIVHAALYLAATLGGLAAMLVLLGAEFVAWTVVLISIGAVVVLFLFGIMVTRAPMDHEPTLSHPRNVKIGAAAGVLRPVRPCRRGRQIEAFGAEALTEPVDATRTGDSRRGVVHPLRHPLRGGVGAATRRPHRWDRAGPQGPGERGAGAVTLTQFVLVGAALFSIGVYGVLTRRNAVLVLLSVELMLAAVSLNLVAFDRQLGDVVAGGQVFALFTIAVSAAEVGIGLAIVLLIFRNRRTANVDDLDLLKL